MYANSSKNAPPIFCIILNRYIRDPVRNKRKRDRRRRAEGIKIEREWEKRKV